MKKNWQQEKKKIRMAHLDDYAPAVPSPLNPTTTPPPPTQRTNQTRRADDLIFLAAPFRRNTEVSPAEMLLRRKAAEAWRSHRLHTRVAEYEMRTVRAITAKRMDLERCDDDPLRAEEGESLWAQLDREEAERKAGNGKEAATGRGDRSNCFRLPQLGFLSATSIMAYGLWRFFGAWRARRNTNS